MNTKRLSGWGRRAGAVAGVVLMVGCGSSTGPGDPELSGVEVTPTFGRVIVPGDSVAFAATGVFEDGSRGPVEVTWSSRDPLVAIVSASGWATAVGNGVTIVEASVGLVVGQAAILVDPDTIAPQLTNAFADSRLVSVFQRTATVRLEIHLEDSGSGLKSALAFFDAPQGAGATGLVTMRKVEDPGAPPNGRTVFEGVLGIPANVGVGTWILSEVQGIDRAGNVGRWGTLDLDALGLSVEIIASLSR